MCTCIDLCVLVAVDAYSLLGLQLAWMIVVVVYTASAFAKNASSELLWEFIQFHFNG